LAIVLLASTLVDIPDVLVGVAGFGLIGSAILASRQALTERRKSKA
jgi:hypothetical protein